MPKDSERWNKRNKRLRVENDYNRVLSEYLLIKHSSIATEFSMFYDSLREKYPDKYFYKGSKRFRAWVRNQIEQYSVAKNTENTTETAEDAVAAKTLTVPVADLPTEEQQPLENVPEAATLGELVSEVVGDPTQPPPPPEEQQPLQNPLENIIANGQQEALDALDGLIGDIIADIENQCDEGIDLSPSHEIEVETLYYDAEIDGLDDIDFDIPLDILLDNLELELENF